MFTDVLQELKSWARTIKQNVWTVYLACKDPRVPWYAKVFAIGVVAYAMSPIDLIPDFIPVLGYLDDVILVPIGISLALKMIPAAVLADCRLKAEEMRRNKKPKTWIAAALIIAIWMLLGLWLGRFVYGWLR